MPQLKVFLGGLLCRFLARQAQRDRRAAALPAGKAEERRQKHLQRCASCRLRLQRERQYLQRLRSAAVPAASDDLTARLLARTGELAATREDPAAGAPVPAPVRDAPLRESPGRPQPARRRPVRFAAAVTGGVAAATCLTAGTAYLMGADPNPGADGAAPSFSDSLTEPVSGPSLSAEGASVPGWRLSSEPDVVPAESLTAGQLAALRDQGWACPELRDLGYHLVWARAGAADGTKVLELRLTDGRSFATILEQHGTTQTGATQTGTTQNGADQHANAQPGSVAGTGPVNVLTGHPAAADGFVTIPLQDPASPEPGRQPTSAAGSAAGPGTLWVNRQAPFRAIYQSAGATFTFVAESPQGQAQDGVVAALVRSRPADSGSTGPAGATAADAGTEALPARLERGLKRVMELLAR